MEKNFSVLTLSFLLAFIMVTCSKNDEGPTAPSTNTIKDITFITIPSGTFEMGDVENVGETGEKPVQTVTLSSFEMSIFEITNAQYVTYLNTALSSGEIEIAPDGALYEGDVFGKSGVWYGERYLNIGLNPDDDIIPVHKYNVDINNQCWILYDGIGTFTVSPGKENWPVVAVTWYGAKSFALYYGFDLPTEAEWEYAARGGRQYLYGTDDGTVNSTKANYNSNIGHPVYVGSYPPNPFGLYDICGNVNEWCHDWYGTYSSISITNPTGPLSGSLCMERGGDWYSISLHCRTSKRARNAPFGNGWFTGFRVVRRSDGLTY